LFDGAASAEDGAGADGAELGALAGAFGWSAAGAAGFSAGAGFWAKTPEFA
jgi:hypothetical protein